jgi:hypothetical protein
MKLGHDTASVVNWIEGNCKPRVPVAGMGATILCWTDREPATIRVVGPTGRYLTFAEDRARIIAGSTMSETQTWEFTADPLARAQVAKLDRRGRWRICDADGKMTSGVLSVGTRDKYVDPCF